MARDSHPDLVHFALAVGGFAIGTTEFATMSLLPYFAHDLGISAPTAGEIASLETPAGCRVDSRPLDEHKAGARVGTNPDRAIARVIGDEIIVPVTHKIA